MKIHLNLMSIKFSVRVIHYPFQLKIILTVITSGILLWAWKDKKRMTVMKLLTPNLQSLSLPLQESNGVCILKSLKQIPACLFVVPWFWVSSRNFCGIMREFKIEESMQSPWSQAPTFLLLSLDLQSLSDNSYGAISRYYNY